MVDGDTSGSEEGPLALARLAARSLSAALGSDRHEVAVVLGTGLDGAFDLLGEPDAVCAFSRIPGFPAPTVPGHRGQVASMPIGGRRVIVFRGRIHLYEDRTVHQAVHAVRTAVEAGCGTVILTNAVGSLDPLVGPGSVVAIGDHLNLTGRSPLIGLHERSGSLPLFVDQTSVWSPRIRSLVHRIDPSVAEGVYAQVVGPQFETPAEIRMMRTMGADLVGMSTAVEAMAAVHLGAEVLGLSLVTNLAAGLAEHVTVDEVRRAGRQAGPRVGRLLRAVLEDPAIG